MDNTVVVTVVEAVADARGVDPTDLQYSLHDFVPPEAIQRLATHGNTPWTLSFELPGHDVTVDSEGAVLVDGEQLADWSR